MKKCFDAIHRLEFGTKENAEGQIEMSNEILAMLSPEKEYVPLTKVCPRKIFRFGSANISLMSVDREICAVHVSLNTSEIHVINIIRLIR